MKYVAVFLASALLGPVSPVEFDWKAGSEIPGTVVRPLFEAAARLSRYPLTATTPTVVIRSNAEFQAEFCPGEDCMVFGSFYERLPNVIFINELTPEWRRAVTVVHESVHYLQHRAGVLVPSCLGVSAAELEAHAAAFRYMIDNRVEGDMTPPHYFCIKGVNQ